MSQLTMDFTDEEKQRAKSHADEILQLLLTGPVSSTRLLKVTHRFSACVKVLRNRGYVIEVEKLEDGTSMHTLTDYVPTVEVTDDWKRDYYASQHWAEKRLERIRFDEFRCCHCRSTDALQVHHWRYDLFNEAIEDLVTLCDTCHERIHGYSAVKLSFPSHVSATVHRQLQPVSEGAAR